MFAFLANSILITFIVWQGNRWMVIKLRNLFPAYNQTPKRIAAQFTIGLGASTIVLIGYCAVFSFLVRGSLPDLNTIASELLIGLAITIIISIIYECAYFFSMWKTTIIEAEELKRQQVLSQFETLKSQVNPHFLFNSLNTLAGLIEEDQDRAVNFVDELSKVYRHILNTRDKETISLEEEMSFLESYLFLLKMRFGENLRTEIRIAPELKKMQLPALTVQQLVENAIKHNIIATGRQLLLTISSDDNGTLTVENNLQKKLSVEPSSGFGLESIRRRFRLLGAKDILVNENEQKFSVTVPLLHPA
jgi:LytS/YehU family sensor histidine kinase